MMKSILLSIIILSVANLSLSTRVVLTGEPITLENSIIPKLEYTCKLTEGTSTVVVNFSDKGKDEEIDLTDEFTFTMVKGTSLSVKSTSRTVLDCEHQLEDDYELDIDIHFKPNEPYNLSNPLLWAVKIACKVTTPDAVDNVSATVQKGTVKVNGQDVGSDYRFDVHNGDALNIEASRSSKAVLTNLGHSEASAKCTIGAIREKALELKFLD